MRRSGTEQGASPGGLGQRLCQEWAAVLWIPARKVPSGSFLTHWKAPHAPTAGRAGGKAATGAKELQVRSAGPGRAGAHSRLEGVLAVEEGEEGGLADQPVVQAGVRAGPPSGSQPGPEGVRWGPGPGDQAGVAGPLEMSGVGGQDEGALRGSGPWGGRAWGCTEVLPRGKQCQEGKWNTSLPTHPVGRGCRGRVFPTPHSLTKLLNNCVIKMKNESLHFCAVIWGLRLELGAQGRGAPGLVSEQYCSALPISNPRAEGNRLEKDLEVKARCTLGRGGASDTGASSAPGDREWGTHLPGAGCRHGPAPASPHTCTRRAGRGPPVQETGRHMGQEKPWASPDLAARPWEQPDLGALTACTQGADHPIHADAPLPGAPFSGPRGPHDSSSLPDPLPLPLSFSSFPKAQHSIPSSAVMPALPQPTTRCTLPS